MHKPHHTPPLTPKQRRLAVLIFLIIAATTLMPRDAQARTVSALVAQAHGDPFACKVAPRWGPRQKRCVVRVVFRREPATGRRAARIIGCESGWDERQVTPPYSASGLAQFLPGTYRGTPYRRHNILSPVWNVKAMRWLWLHDGKSFREWVCT